MQDILALYKKIEATMTAATTEEKFLADEVLPTAALHHLTAMGEAINRLSPELRRRHPGVRWQQNVSLRPCKAWGTILLIALRQEEGEDFHGKALAEKRETEGRLYQM